MTLLVTSDCLHMTLLVCLTAESSSAAALLIGDSLTLPTLHCRVPLPAAARLPLLFFGSDIGKGLFYCSFVFL